DRGGGGRLAPHRPRHAVEIARRLDADEPVDDVLEHPLRRARPRVLPAAAASLPEADDGALARLDPGAHDADLELVVPAPVVDQAAAQRRVASLPSPDRLRPATAEDGQRRITVRELEVTGDADASAMAAGAGRVGDELVAMRQHRVDALLHLDRLVARAGRVQADGGVVVLLAGSAAVPAFLPDVHDE